MTAIFRLFQLVQLGRRFRDFAVDTFIRSNRSFGQAVEEKVRGHAQYIRELPKLAGRDAVLALFVLLDLLEGQPNCRRELCLGHSIRFADKAKFGTDVNINFFRC